MKTPHLLLLLVCTACSSFVAWADRDVGNGGDVVVCNAESGQPPIELLDVFEAKRAGFVLDFGPRHLGVGGRVKHVLSRLETLDRARLQYYLDELSLLVDENSWRADSSDIQHGTVLEDIPDEAGYRSLPNGCHIEQIVIQSLQPLPFQKRITVDEDLWEGLTSESQVALILHELLFADALYNGTAKSWQVRHLNGQLLRHDFKSLSKHEYEELLKLTNFYENALRIGGIWIDAPSIELSESGKVRAGNLSTKQSGTPIQNSGEETFILRFDQPPRVEMFEDGQIATLIVPRFELPTRLKVEFDRPEDCDFRAEVNDSVVNFHPNGRLAKLEGWLSSGLLCIGDVRIRLDRNSKLSYHDTGAVAEYHGSLSLPVEGQIISVRNQILFHPSGKIESGIMSDTYLLKTTKFDQRWYHKGSWVKFNDGGLVQLP